MTKNLVILDSDAHLASSDSCDDSDTENYNSELHHYFMLLLYSDTGISSDCYELRCSLSTDKSVSVTKSGNHNQQILEQNCAQESASWEVTPCCSKCHILEDKILSKTSVTTSSLASWSSCHNSTHPKQLKYWRKQYDLTTIPDHSELPSDTCTSAFWTDCLCTCKVEMDSKNKIS